MVITKIIAGAQSGFNHPFEQFANFKPSITIEALVEPGENADQVARNVQQMAQSFCDAERARIEAKLQLEHDIEHAENCVRQWESDVASKERTIAEAPGILAGYSEGSWEHNNAIRDLEYAKRDLPSARVALGEARLNLAKLKPDTLRIVLRQDTFSGPELSRCTVGELVKSNPDLGYSAQQIAEWLLDSKQHGWGLNLGAGGITVLIAEHFAF